jgi:hypothetical protein
MAVVTITTQYYENYGFHEGTEHWKPKGGFDFVVKVSSDILMYTNNLKAILSQMVQEQSNQLERFEYIEHSVAFSEPHLLDTNRFIELVKQED